MMVSSSVSAAWWDWGEGREGGKEKRVSYLFSASTFKARLSHSHWMVRALHTSPALSIVVRSSVSAAWWDWEKE